MTNSTELVEIIRNQTVTTSLKVAEVFEKRHDRVIRAIEDILANLAEIEPEQVTTKLGNGVSTPLFRKATYQAEEGGRKYPFYYMNRDGFTLLAMGFTGKKALEFKLAYIAAFNAMADVLRNWKNPEWQEARHEVKVVFRKLTDAIKDVIIPLARANGSTTPDDKFYMCWANMLCKVGCYNPRSRDKLPLGHMFILHQLEDIAVTQIRGLNALNILDYRAIYRQTKIKLNNFARIAMINERFGRKELPA